MKNHEKSSKIEVSRRFGARIEAFGAFFAADGMPRRPVLIHQGRLSAHALQAPRMRAVRAGHHLGTRARGSVSKLFRASEAMFPPEDLKILMVFHENPLKIHHLSIHAP